MIKKAFITGINGFVGPYLQKYLEEKNIEVYGADRTSCDEQKTFCLDILDKKKLTEIINKTKPNVIFHLAGLSSPAQSFKQPELTMKINVEGTRNLFEAASALNPPPKIIIISSSHVYGKPTKSPIDETEPLKSDSPYAESRIEQEKLAKEYPSIPCVIMRSFNHIGPNQTEEFVVPAFAKQIIEIKKGLTKPVIETGNLEAIRDFSDVRDIVRGYYLAATKGKPGEIYNIGSRNGYKIEDILDKLINLAKIEVTHKLDPKRLRPSDIPELICDYSKFSHDTEWKPEYTIDDTLTGILNYWDKQIS